MIFRLYAQTVLTDVSQPDSSAPNKIQCFLRILRCKTRSVHIRLVSHISISRDRWYCSGKGSLRLAVPETLVLRYIDLDGQFQEDHDQRGLWMRRGFGAYVDLPSDVSDIVSFISQRNITHQHGLSAPSHEV
jgi:hypothetical protein